MSRLLVAAGWAGAGLLVGLAVNVFSSWQAGIEARSDPELDPVMRPWEVAIAPALCAALFGIFAWRIGWGVLLLIDSVYVAILVQVFAFDLKHRYILDVVMLPGWLVALALAFVTPWTPGLSWPAPDWRTAVLAAVIAGLVFFVLFFVGTWIFGQEAFGFGDVKLAVFIGLCTGLTDLRMVHALLAGVYIGGAVAVILLLTRRARMRQAVPYGPFLVAGTVLTLLLQRP
ncbi:MAG TPA: A24 family peptidase [Candidatus Limnocylindrales bacterium]|nr:A24 family peptidase [Candidatus Limnocylindrales bacterium]